MPGVPFVVNPQQSGILPMALSMAAQGGRNQDRDRLLDMMFAQQQRQNQGSQLLQTLLPFMLQQGALREQSRQFDITQSGVGAQLKELITAGQEGRQFTREQAALTRQETTNLFEEQTRRFGIESERAGRALESGLATESQQRESLANQLGDQLALLEQGQTGRSEVASIQAEPARIQAETMADQFAQLLEGQKLTRATEAFQAGQTGILERSGAEARSIGLQQEEVQERFQNATLDAERDAQLHLGDIKRGFTNLAKHEQADKAVSTLIGKALGLQGTDPIRALAYLNALENAQRDESFDDLLKRTSKAGKEIRRFLKSKFATDIRQRGREAMSFIGERRTFQEREAGLLGSLRAASAPGVNALRGVSSAVPVLDDQGNIIGFQAPGTPNAILPEDTGIATDEQARRFQQLLENIGGG